MSSPCFGRIVWAVITDTRGHAREIHPAVIITPDYRIAAGARLQAVGVSTKGHFSTESARTPLPYGPRGRCRTGLTRECWAFSDWVVELGVEDVHDYAGLVPPPVMVEILGKIPKPA